MQKFNGVLAAAALKPPARLGLPALCRTIEVNGAWTEVVLFALLKEKSFMSFVLVKCQNAFKNKMLLIGLLK